MMHHRCYFYGSGRSFRQIVGRNIASGVHRRRQGGQIKQAAIAAIMRGRGDEKKMSEQEDSRKFEHLQAALKHDHQPKAHPTDLVFESHSERKYDHQPKAHPTDLVFGSDILSDDHQPKAHPTYLVYGSDSER
jgi:hypothetical protein